MAIWHTLTFLFRWVENDLSKGTITSWIMWEDYSGTPKTQSMLLWSHKMRYAYALWLCNKLLYIISYFFSFVRKDDINFYKVKIESESKFLGKDQNTLSREICHQSQIQSTLHFWISIGKKKHYLFKDEVFSLTHLNQSIT